MSGERQLALGLPIDPNEASQADLEALPDVGPALAQAIVTARRQRRFLTEVDLLAVRGLGPKRLAKLRPYLQLRKTR
jgi:competence protein ComEA